MDYGHYTKTKPRLKNQTNNKTLKSMKKLFLAVIITLILNFSHAQKSEQCKFYTFSCPPSTSQVCSNSKLYKELETSNGFDGIYSKTNNGCWVVSGSAVTIPREKSTILARLRRIFGNNSVTPKK